MASGDPWAGPKGAFIYIEAEDFELDGPGWEKLNDAGKRTTLTSSGYRSLSGASKEKGVARATLVVPEARQYRCWVRYAQFQRPQESNRAPFQMTLRQSDKPVHQMMVDQAYDGRVPTGRGSPYPSYEWQSATLDLQRGPAVLEFEKAKLTKVDSDLRRIDCILLTTDLIHEPDHRDFGPQSYLRVRVESAEPGRIVFEAFMNHMRAPFYKRAAFDRSGMHLGVVPRSPEEAMLSPGEATPWLNISRLLDSGWDTNIKVSAVAKMNGNEPEYATGSAFALDFASSPSDGAIVKTLRRDGPGYGLIFRIGSTVNADDPPKSDLEFARETVALVEGLPPVTFGRRPTLFPVMTDWLASDRTHTPGTQAAELQVMEYLGINAKALGLLEAADIEAGILYGRLRTTSWFQGKGGYNEPLIDKMTAQIAKRGADYRQDPYRDRYIYTKLHDEATATPLERLAPNPTNQVAFRDWLRTRGTTPEQLGVASWEEVEILTKQDAGTPEMYVASQRFRAASIAEFFAVGTDLVHEHYGSEVKTTQNFSDGAVYMANMYAQGNDYYTWFKRGALDLATSEDWTALGSTPQCCGWNVAILRSATKYRKQPIGMYVISYGPALDTKLRAYSDLAQGAKNLNFYAYGPLYQGHERGWSQRPQTYRAIAEVTHEIGGAEEVLLDAMPRRASTAIIYSVSSDIWDVRRSNAMGFERMNTYLAMRHGQVAVDVLSEDDVIEGRLEKYATAYLFGDQLDGRVPALLAAWVNGGGSLVLAPGAGERDELNRPMALLDDELRIARGPSEEFQTMWTSGRNIDTALRSHGKIVVEGRADPVPLLAKRQAMKQQAGATVLARFEDGSPASVAQRVGNGRVVMNGFTPALAYVSEALAASKAGAVDPAGKRRGNPDIEASMQQESEMLSDKSRSTAPTAFDDSLRQFILQPVAESGHEEPVSTDHPLVEATLMEGTKGWVVLLANYTGEPINDLAVTVRVGPRSFNSIQSSRQGPLGSADVREGVVRVRVPLESTDMITGMWLEDRETQSSP